GPRQPRHGVPPRRGSRRCRRAVRGRHAGAAGLCPGLRQPRRGLPPAGPRRRRPPDVRAPPRPRSRRPAGPRLPPPTRTRMTMRSTAFLLALLTLAACGGSPEPADGHLRLDTERRDPERMLRFYFGSYLGPDGGDAVEAGL